MYHSNVMCYRILFLEHQICRIPLLWRRFALLEKLSNLGLRMVVAISLGPPSQRPPALHDYQSVWVVLLCSIRLCGLL